MTRKINLGMFAIIMLSVLSNLFLANTSVVLAENYTIGGAGDNLNKVVDETQTGISVNKIDGPTGFIATLVKGALSATGFVFFLLTIYGGFLWMTARGDDTMVEKGRDIVIQATIGLAIIVGAYAITTLIIKAAI